MSPSFFRWFWRGILLLVILIVIPYSWALILALLTAILLDGLVRMIGETAKLHRFLGRIDFICFICRRAYEHHLFFFFRY
ncbi:hypothetical protein RCO48_36160 [Peribacillus frigoritolerans]|nr:hypothetical protein [Peribacillus frigoritolerans]